MKHVKRVLNISNAFEKFETCFEYSQCIILGDKKESEMFLMEASEESIMIIQPRCHSGMYYSGTGLLVQILSDFTEFFDVNVLSMRYLMGSMYTRKSRRQRTDPWGTPVLTLTISETASLAWTLLWRSVRWDSSHLSAGLLTATESSSLCGRIV